MRELLLETGGRPDAWDDDLTLMELFTIGVQDQFKDLGAFVFSGCEVTGPTSISSGLVYIDGRVLQFDEVTDADFSSPKYIVQSPPLSFDQRQFANGNSIDTRIDYRAELTDTEPSDGSAFVRVTSAGSTAKLDLSIYDPTAGNRLQDEFRRERTLFDLNPGIQGSTVNWDAKDGRIGTLTIGGSFTLNDLTNKEPGTYLLIVTIASAGADITFGPNFKFPDNGTAPSFSNETGAVDVLTFLCDGNVFYGVGQTNFK
ncbi:MAG: hypothetical protein AAFX87_24920 [Bacteroidota bacterium]